MDLDKKNIHSQCLIGLISQTPQLSCLKKEDLKSVLIHLTSVIDTASNIEVYLGKPLNESDCRMVSCNTGSWKIESKIITKIQVRSGR